VPPEARGVPPPAVLSLALEKEPFPVGARYIVPSFRLSNFHFSRFLPFPSLSFRVPLFFVPPVRISRE
jgi:hypothetical protein